MDNLGFIYNQIDQILFNNLIDVGDYDNLQVGVMQAFISNSQPLADDLQNIKNKNFPSILIINSMETS